MKEDDGRTLTFRQNPETGYAPLVAILDGTKQTTLWRDRIRGDREVVLELDGERVNTGVTVRMVRWDCVFREPFPGDYPGRDRIRHPDGYLVDELARGDGVEDAEAMAKAIMDAHGGLPEAMWLNGFEVVEG